MENTYNKIFYGKNHPQECGNLPTAKCQLGLEAKNSGAEQSRKCIVSVLMGAYTGSLAPFQGASHGVNGSWDFNP
jgi:hypothetical protein